MGRDGDLLGLALGDALLSARELHAQDAEVGSPEIQGVEEPLLIPEFRIVVTTCKQIDFRIRGVHTIRNMNKRSK